MCSVGEILKDEFLFHFGLSKKELSKKIDVPYNKVKDIISGREKITPEIDLKLTRYFGLTTGYFLRIQDYIKEING